MRNRFLIYIIFLSLFTILPNSQASAQFGGLGKILKDKAGIKMPSLNKKKRPITTNIKDAVYGDPTQDGFTPPTPVQQLTSLDRTPYGGFILKAGYYEMMAQSYCLKAGTHGPGGGDGYLYGPLKGKAETIVQNILQNSVAHPEIPQRDIQLLLWAIMARAKYETLQPNVQLAATTLLDPDQVAKLRTNALSILNSRQMRRLLGKASPSLRNVLQAEANMRRTFSRPNATYAEFERIAVLAGDVGLGAGSKEIPVGRWSLHPDGYYIRYIPSGYSKTTVQIWVPANSDGIDEIYDPAVHVAVPGNTSRQRLGQSGRLKG